MKYNKCSSWEYHLDPRYLTSLIRPIYWALIQKLRCLVMLDWDFGLNNKISVLLAFNDILFALSQMFSSFKSWLMCLFIFFSDLSESSRFMSSAKWCTSLYLIALLRSFMQMRNNKGPKAVLKFSVGLERFHLKKKG